MPSRRRTARPLPALGPSARQRLTAIFAADAVGYSQLMAGDEQATVASLDAARTVFRARIGSHHGRVIDMAGDSVLAVFETAAGAVSAALEIQDDLAAAAAVEPEERRMRFRIGVHLGDVIEKADGTVYGDGVNVAARLEGLAEPGGITISDAVRAVIGGRLKATFTDQGRQQLKNIPSPIHAYAVRRHGRPEAEDGGAAVMPAAAAGQAPQRAPRTDEDTGHRAPSDAPPDARRPAPRPTQLFVGRKQELADLADALDRAKSGRGQVVLLAGPGGMGKTRLAQQLAMRAEQEDVAVFWGRCLEEPGAPPYWPWRQLIRGYLRHSGDVDAAATFGAGLADISGIVPELAQRQATAQPSEPIGENAQSRFRLFDAVAGFWRRAARRTPLLLVFEDLHWADATSLRLFAFLANEIEDCPVLVLGSYRDTELSRQHPMFDTLAELARLAVFHRIELAGLSSRETEQFMTAASGATASANFVSAMHARTEGHPLFLEETLRVILEGRAAQAAGSGGDDLHALMQIPTGVREVIGKRLNGLSASAGRLLSTAACIGRSFEVELLLALEAERSEDHVLAALEEALSVHLIEAVPETQQFRFSHALIRETLYDEMLGLRRARLHLRIGEWLEQRLAASDEIVLPQLAHHYSQAGPGAAAKGLDYAARSAERAAQLLAFEEAVRLYRLALHLQHQHFAKDVERRCALLLSLGEVELSLGAGEPARAVYEEAAALSRSQGLSARFAQAAAGFERSTTLTARSGEPAVALLLEAVALHQTDDPLRVELLARLCRAHVYSGRADEAKAAHARAVALARRIGDTSGLFLALAAIVSASYWPDMLHDRLAAANEAWRIADDRSLALPVVDLLPFFLADLVHVGDTPALRHLLDQGQQLAERARLPYLQTLCRHTEALLAINEGRFEQAEVWATRALESGRRIAEDQAVGTYGMQMFCLRREQGRLGEALPMLQHFLRTTHEAQVWQPGLALLYAELDMRAESLAQFDTLPWRRLTQPPSDVGTMTVLMFAAETCVYLRDAARAALLYPMIQMHAGSNLMADFGGPCLGSADRLLGKLATVTERWDAAQAHFEAALAMDRRTGSRVWLAHSAYAYAVMLHRRCGDGDADRARTLLADALAESEALGMGALTPRIRSLADAIAAPAPAYPCGLTEREVGVLQLMAMGRNNREIGQVLDISPNTVANHVRSILEKTYTANRTEAAAFANREGLLKT